MVLTRQCRRGISYRGCCSDYSFRHLRRHDSIVVYRHKGT
jgi:hypothetical protein